MTVTASKPAAPSSDNTTKMPAPGRHVDQETAEEGRCDRRDAAHQHEEREHARRGRALLTISDDRAGDDDCDTAEQTLREPEHDERRRCRCERGREAEDGVAADAHEQRPPPTERIADRATEQLAEREAEQARGQGQLDLRLRDAEAVGDLRERGQVHVERQRRHRAEAAEHQQHRHGDARLDAGVGSSGSSRSSSVSRGRSHHTFGDECLPPVGHPELFDDLLAVDAGDGAGWAEPHVCLGETRAWTHGEPARLDLDDDAARTSDRIGRGLLPGHRQVGCSARGD